MAICKDLPARPTSLILHSWDEEGLRYITGAYGHLRGLTVAGVSQQVLNRYAGWIAAGRASAGGIASAAGDGMDDRQGVRDPITASLSPGWAGRWRAKG